MKNIFYAKEHIFVCAQKNLSVPKKGDFCPKRRKFLCEKEGIFVRKRENFCAKGNKISCGRKFSPKRVGRRPLGLPQVG
ncbi:hypothetical protein [Porphyromonas sp. COT-108 OH1349]|uniref:hypothetical protein n=1 Tax=Porphyromonas sp. COT-108 OH1349 TaxID=1537504 RepID=UPI001269DFF9|nr:hypothetical protein [Porphyromonas sp. COT-108 OH1349]